MNSEIQVGFVIEMDDATRGTATAFVEKGDILYNGILNLLAQAEAQNKMLYRSLRERYPELDAWEFRIDHKTGKLVVTLPRGDD